MATGFYKAFNNATADIQIAPAVRANTRVTNYPVQTPSGVMYSFFVGAAASHFVFAKSSDGGLTWAPVVLLNSNSSATPAIFYDKWAGLSGGLIHVAYTNDTQDLLLYRTIDTENSDSISTEITVATFTSSVTNNAYISIARSRGGNVYILTSVDAGVEGGFYRLPNANVPAGAWDAARTINEALAAGDYAILLPGFAADNQDMLVIFYDAGSLEISRQIYDDSANTWAETSIATSMTLSPTGVMHFAAAVDLVNSRHYVAAWSNADTANADLRFWKITETSITEMTNVVLNSTDDQGMCAVGLEISTGRIYVFYGGKSDGSETYNTDINIYYKFSDDGGSTWGSEIRATKSGNTWTIQALHAVPRIYTKWAVHWCYDRSGSNFDRMMMTTPLPSGP